MIFYAEYKPLRSLEEIRADILALEEETDGLIMEHLIVKTKIFYQALYLLG